MGDVNETKAIRRKRKDEGDVEEEEEGLKGENEN